MLNKYREDVARAVDVSADDILLHCTFDDKSDGDAESGGRTVVWTDAVTSVAFTVVGGGNPEVSNGALTGNIGGAGQSYLDTADEADNAFDCAINTLNGGGLGQARGDGSVLTLFKTSSPTGSGDMFSYGGFALGSRPLQRGIVMQNDGMVWSVDYGNGYQTTFQNIDDVPADTLVLQEFKYFDHSQAWTFAQYYLSGGVATLVGGVDFTFITGQIRSDYSPAETPNQRPIRLGAEDHQSLVSVQVRRGSHYPYKAPGVVYTLADILKLGYLPGFA